MFNGFTRRRAGGFAGGAGISVISIGSGGSPVVNGLIVNTGGTISGVTVHVLLDGVEVGTATTDSLGMWSYTLSSPSAGAHVVSATAILNIVSIGFVFVETSAAVGITPAFYLIVASYGIINFTRRF